VFTANGKRYPYPGALDLPAGYERNDAAMTAAEFTGEPDDRTPFYLARQAADREGLETKKSNGVTLVMQMKGQAGFFAVAADTLLALGAVIEACGADSLRMYTQPYLGHTLVTVRVGIVLVQFMPMPVPADILKDPLACWRIDNPQLSIA
ncbi:MAG: hypothetical protein NC048_10325, partial [Bacteroides sp.]|nr:hypothetical protein [Bacteroides sp.]